MTNQLADVADAAGMDDGRAEDCEDLFPRLACAPHGLGDLPDGHALGFLAGDRAGHELEQVLPCRHLRREDAQSLPADHDGVALAHIGHRHARAARAFGIDQDAAVHLLIFDLDPLAVQANLCPVVRGAVEAFGKRPVHVRRDNAQSRATVGAAHDRESGRGCP